MATVLSLEHSTVAFPMATALSPSAGAAHDNGAEHKKQKSIEKQLRWYEVELWEGVWWHQVSLWRAVS